jgi:tetratricopeptide (TPR) repeat protein
MQPKEETLRKVGTLLYFGPLLFCLFLLALVCVLTTRAHAYSSDVNQEITELIGQKDFEGARERIEQYLAKDPDHIDALMMKGNVILNEYVQPLADVSVVSNSNESIYDDSIGMIANPREKMVLPEDITREVAELWLRCLDLDSTREDIHKGLCTIYARALMLDDLIGHLSVMKAALAEKNLMYTMGNYARQVNERGGFGPAMEVYQAIQDLYPGHAGVTSDRAAMHFRFGNIETGARLIRAALVQGAGDEMILGNGVTMLTIVEDYEGALGAFRELERVTGDNSEWIFYRSLYRQYMGEKSWRDDLDQFKNSRPETGSSTLEEYMVSIGQLENFEQFEEAMKKPGQIWSTLLLHRIAMKKFPDRHEPVLSYANFLSYHRNYPRAIELYRSLFKGTLAGQLSIEEAESARFIYAWTLYDSGQQKEADQHWQVLLGSEQFYIKSAAAYFHGKHLLSIGNLKEAYRVFNLVSTRASESKYAALCLNAITCRDAGEKPFDAE